MPGSFYEEDEWHEPDYRRGYGYVPPKPPPQRFDSLQPTPNAGQDGSNLTPRVLRFSPAPNIYVYNSRHTPPQAPSYTQPIPDERTPYRSAVDFERPSSLGRHNRAHGDPDRWHNWQSWRDYEERVRTREASAQIVHSGHAWHPQREDEIKEEIWALKRLQQSPQMTTSPHRPVGVQMGSRQAELANLHAELDHNAALSHEQRTAAIIRILDLERELMKEMDGHSSKIAGGTPWNGVENLDFSSVKKLKLDTVGHLSKFGKRKDLTVHLEFDIVEDLDENMEELSRLRRLGQYEEAKKFCASQLGGHLGTPYVGVQYAEMLLDTGRFADIEVSDFSHVLGAKHRDAPADDLLHLNGRLVLALAGLHTGTAKIADAIRLANEAFASVDKLSRDSPLGSSEYQLLSLGMRIYALLCSTGRSELARDHGRDYYDFEAKAMRFDWSTTYRDMVANGQIWDFRDLFKAACLCFGVARMIEKFSNPTNSANAFGLFSDWTEIFLRTIFADWVTPEYSRSTNLALLDLTTFVVVLHGEESKKLHDLNRAVALSIVKNDPNSLQSRQYVRWILADVWHSNLQERLEHQNAFLANSGVLLSCMLEMPTLPIYVPINSETPDCITVIRESDQDTLRIALGTARQLGDLDTEASCLKLLIMSTKNASDLFDELIHLQHHRQNDRNGCLQTQLARYTICRDARSRALLRQKLKSFGPRLNLNKALLWARSMILKSLAESSEEAESYKAEAESMLDELPEEFDRELYGFPPKAVIESKGLGQAAGSSRGQSLGPISRVATVMSDYQPLASDFRLQRKPAQDVTHKTLDRRDWTEPRQPEPATEDEKQSTNQAAPPEISKFSIETAATSVAGEIPADERFQLLSSDDEGIGWAKKKGTKDTFNASKQEQEDTSRELEPSVGGARSEGDASHVQKKTVEFSEISKGTESLAGKKTPHVEEVSDEASDEAINEVGDKHDADIGLYD